MFKRLNLSGNDIVRKAEPHLMDGDSGWLVMDYEDIVGPQYPRTGATFRRLPLKRGIGRRRTLWRRGDPLR